MRDLPLFPPQASSSAVAVDTLYVFLILSTVSLAILLAFLVITFAIKYHRRSPSEVPVQIHGNNPLEFGWTGATLVLFLIMFFWGAHVYFGMVVPPPDALEVFAVGKQWMWKVQHPTGQREINELHIPVGKPVRVTLTSQDVIHSFFIPAFRTKQDAVPGRYTTLSFTATKPGKYHLFCSEYCGAKHSGMIGWVYAMEPYQYAAWLTAGGAEGSLASRGEKLYHQYGCSTCHDLTGHGPGPSFKGLYGTQVRLTDGTTVTANEAYIRESILQPQAKIVLGFGTIMPTFQGQLDEDQILALIEWMKAIGAAAAEQVPSTPGSVPQRVGAGPGIGQTKGTSSITGSAPAQR